MREVLQISKIFAVIIGIVVVVVGAFFLINPGYFSDIGTNIGTGAQTGAATQPQSEVQESTGGTDNTIEITSGGFSPSSLTIDVDEIVTFLNKGQTPSWPASAFHPTHTAYPGSDINKCGTGEEIFDACRGLAEGESWAFTFNEIGTWAYHNHLNPIHFGSITVQ